MTWLRSHSKSMAKPKPVLIQINPVSSPPPRWGENSLQEPRIRHDVSSLKNGSLYPLSNINTDEKSVVHPDGSVPRGGARCGGGGVRLTVRKHLESDPSLVPSHPPVILILRRTSEERAPRKTGQPEPRCEVVSIV